MASSCSSVESTVKVSATREKSLLVSSTRRSSVTKSMLLETSIQLPLPEAFANARSFLFFLWRLALGISALLDFSASIVAPRFTRDNVQIDSDTDAVSGLQTWVTVPNVAQFLHDHEAPLADIFHIFWLIDAFVVAKSLSKQAETNPGYIYIGKMACQLGLLPIGFYTKVCEVVLLLLRGQKDHPKDLAVQFEDDFGKSVRVILPRGWTSIPSEYETFSARSNTSIAIVLVRQLVFTFSSLAHGRVTQEVKKLVVRKIPRVLRSVIRHPLQSIHEGQSILRKIRLAKFLFPLVLAQNKLIRQLVEYAREFVGKILGHRLKFNRNNPGNRAPSDSTKTRGQGKSAPVSFQSVVHNENVSHDSLPESNGTTTLKKKQSKRHSRRDLYKRLQEQEDLSQEAKDWINKKFLMPPTSRFILNWKLLFVCCALFETVVLLGPKPPELQLYQENEIKSKRPLRHGLDGMSATTLRPPHVSSWAECQVVDDAKRKNGPLFRIRKLIKARSGRSDDEHISRSLSLLPWYCHEPFASIQQKARTVVGFIAYHFLLFVSFICLLDMYVSFFTGEYDSDCEALVAKPFLKRWIFPGVLTQLAVNPKLEGMLRVAGRLIEMGPARVWQWFVILFFPMVYALWYTVEENIWLPLAAYQQDVMEDISLNNEADKDDASGIFVEDASDSEVDGEEFSNNLRPSPGQWIEPVEMEDRR